MAKDERLQLRLNYKDKAEIMKRAIDLKMTTTEYVIYACTKEMNEVKKDK